MELSQGRSNKVKTHNHLSNKNMDKLREIETPDKTLDVNGDM